jgi:2-haloacid dehalogenase/putative hydrolase of the HAD superfamily
MPVAGPKALLWDVGKVILRWDPENLYKKIFPDPAERARFFAEVCTMDWHLAHDLGVTFAENRAPLIDRFPEHEEAIRAWGDRWAEMISGSFAETEAVIEALAARGVPQYVLSNMSDEVLAQHVALSPAFERMAGIVISGTVGVLKPEPAIYHEVCRRFGMAPGDFLFVDDSLANIEAAARLGFDVHHFTDPAALRPAVEARGLL